MEYPKFEIGDVVLCVYPSIGNMGENDTLKQFKKYKIRGLDKKSGTKIMMSLVDFDNNKEIYLGYYSTRFLNLSRINTDEYTKSQIEFVNRILKIFPELMATDFIEFDKSGLIKQKGEIK
jgi:hypothetical protein